jgi:hypothetical protein
MRSELVNCMDCFHHFYLNVMNYVKLVFPLHWDDQFYVIWMRKHTAVSTASSKELELCSFFITSGRERERERVLCWRGSEVNKIGDIKNFFSTVVKENPLQLVLLQQTVLPTCCHKCCCLVKENVCSDQWCIACLRCLKRFAQP